MAVAKRPGREKPARIEQRKVGGPGVRSSGKTNNTPGRPNLQKTGPRTGKHTEEEPKRSLSLSAPQRDGELFSLRLWIDVPSRLVDGFSCYYLNKIEL